MIWTAKLIKHRDEKRIAVSFEKNAEFNAQIRKLDGSKWSSTLRVWHLPNTAVYREQFNIENKEPSDEAKEQIVKLQKWLLSKRYSPNTIKTYSEALKSFLTFFKNKSIVQITNDDIITYNNEYILKNNLSASYQNQIVHPVG